MANQKIRNLKKKLSRMDDTKKMFLKYGGTIVGTAGACAAIYAFFKEKIDADILPFFQSTGIAFTMPVAVITLLALLIVIGFDYFRKVTELEVKIAEAEPFKERVPELEKQVSELEDKVAEAEPFKERVPELEAQVSEMEDKVAEAEPLKKRVQELEVIVDTLTQERDQYADREKERQKKSDSIMDMLNHAREKKQHNEIIKIGTSVSDFLWTTSRKDLRIKVGGRVAAAALDVAVASTNKAVVDRVNRIRAKTLIEDIGNTKMCLKEDMVDEAIIDIRAGLALAEEHGYFYEAVRGHRNLANCYALKAHKCKKTNQPQAKQELEHAQQEVERAEEIILSILDEKKQAEARFDVEYAKAKIHSEGGRPEEAIHVLKNCIRLFEEEKNKDAAAEHIYADRLVKIYREMGIVYTSISNKQIAARDAFRKGLSKAMERQNHEDIVRCCTHLIELQLQYRFADSADSVHDWINEGESNLNMVDTKKHIEKFNEIKQKWMDKGNGHK